MIIHVGGCDGSGKSTIVDYLSKKTGYPHRHFDKPKDLEDGKKQYFHVAETNRGALICDRYHDGEWVYAPLYRGYMGDYLRSLESKIVENNNYIFAYVKADLQTIKERTRVRGEDFVKEEHFELVLNYYEKYLVNQALPFIEIDTTDIDIFENIDNITNAKDKIDQIYNKIRHYDKEFDKRVITQKVVFPRGNINAKYMIVSSTPFKSENSYSTLFSGEEGTKQVIKAIDEDMKKNSWFASILPFPTHDNKLTNNQKETAGDLIKLQYELIKPKFVIAVDIVAKKALEELLGVEVHIFNNFVQARK